MRRAARCYCRNPGKKGGGLDQDACRVGSEKWSDAGYVLMAEPIGFAPGLYEQSEGRRGIKNHSSFQA